MPLLTSLEGGHLIAWLHNVGTTPVFGFTLGHSVETFENSVYLDTIARAAEYLTNGLESETIAVNGSKRNKLFIIILEL